MTAVVKDTLYKKDSTGKIRIWAMEIDGARYRTASGIPGGKTVVSDYTTAVAKNVGRANETTAEQQAELEVEAEYTKKLKTGYHRSKDDVDNQGYIKPMLAEKWDDRIIVGHQRIFVQPKFDGFRCIATKDGLFSRKGEKFLAAPHIEAALAPMFAELPNMILDGELYNHELKDDFNKIASLVRKQNPTPAQLDETAKMVQFYVYDIVDMNNNNKFSDRLKGLAERVFGVFFQNSTVIRPVETYEVTTKEGMDELYGRFIEQGYEGQMVRLDGVYQNKRSKFLMKRKEFQDNEYEIVAIEEGLGNRSNMAGRVTLKLPDGRTFGAGIKGGLAYNKQLWADKENLVGKKGTVEFFALTPDGIPRFPVFKAVREDI